MAEFDYKDGYAIINSRRNKLWKENQNGRSKKDKNQGGDRIRR